MLNVVTSRSRSSITLRRADPYFQVRLSTLRKLFTPGLCPVSYMTVSKSRPPNFALTLVNWWSKKPHRTLHHADTDEEMVSQYPAIYYCGIQLTKRAIRFRSSKVTRTDQSRKANTSWVDVIGAKPCWRRRRVIYHSTSVWKRRKGMERRSGKAICAGSVISDLLNPCRYSVRAPAPRWIPTVPVE
jgi:hypothetical protein